VANTATEKGQTNISQEHSFDDVTQTLKPGSSIAVCESAVKQHPENPRFLFQLGLAYEDRRQDHKAIRYYRKAAELGLSDAHSKLGWLYFDGVAVSRNYAEARKWYNKKYERLPSE
jgi:TPR repeat protein